MAILTTLQSTDTLSNSRVPINNNFAALNAAKVEGAASLLNAGRLVKVTAAGIVGESILSEAGGAITISGDLSVTGAITGSSFPWANISGKPTAVSAFANDAGYLTAAALANYADKTVPNTFAAGVTAPEFAINGNLASWQFKTYSANQLVAANTVDADAYHTLELASLWSANRTGKGLLRVYGAEAGGWNNYGFLTHNGYDAIVGSGAGVLVFAAGGLSAEKARLTTGGNLIIGKTTDNGARLQVAGQVAADGAGGGVFYAGSTVSQYLLSTSLAGGVNNGNYGLYWDKTNEALELWTASIRRARFFGTGAVQFAGAVESASGGFKFPDGQTQSVAMTTERRYRTLGLTIDGGGSAIATGSKGYIYVPFNCTLDLWTVLGDQAGSITIDVKRSTYAGFPATTSIVGAGNKPALSSVQKNQATPSGWTSTSLSAGDVIEFTVDSAATLTRASISLRVTV